MIVVNLNFDKYQKPAHYFFIKYKLAQLKKNFPLSEF